jgi:hypothetical protein
MIQKGRWNNQFPFTRQEMGTERRPFSAGGWALEKHRANIDLHWISRKPPGKESPLQVEPDANPLSFFKIPSSLTYSMECGNFIYPYTPGVLFFFL